MIKRITTPIVPPLLLFILLFSSCSPAAAGTTDSKASADRTATETTTETATETTTEETTTEAYADTEGTEDMQGTKDSANAFSAGSGTGATAAGTSALSGEEIYENLYGGLRDLYAMETYDAVPDYFSERHGDVDYGTIDEDVEYWSDTAGDYKYCNVLLPAGYDESQEYPVLYMYHGFGGRYDSHVHEDSILQTLYGNMLSEGLAVPMIIVGADMYTDILAEKDGKSDAEMRPCYDKGVDDFTQDLMPFIEDRYPVKKGRMNTAVTGVSQGATEALAIAFKWQSRVAYVGSFAPCTGVIPIPFSGNSFWSWPILDDLTLESPQTMPRYIYLTVGTEDPWCIRSTAYYGEVMNEKGIPNQNDLVEGYDHGNDLWELGHYNFLQKVFLDGTE